MIERGTSSQQIAIIRKTCRFSRRRSKRDHAAYQAPSQPQVVQYVPFFVIRGAQADTHKVSSTMREQMRGWWYPWRRVGAPPEAHGNQYE
jgi:hypothetical protein